MDIEEKIENSIEKIKLRERLLSDIKTDFKAMQDLTNTVVSNRPTTITLEFEKLQNAFIKICDRLVTQINDIRNHINE